MTVAGVLAVVGRAATAILFGIIGARLQGKYRTAKEDGAPPETTRYFLGYSLFFFITGVTLLGVGADKLLQLLGKAPMEFTARFPYGDPNDSGFLANFTRPLYLALLLLVLLLFATQVAPLEYMVWKKQYVTVFLVISTALVATVYIPALTYGLYSMIVIMTAFVAILLAFLLNFGMNLSIYFKTTGDLRRRAGFIAVGFFVFLIGLVWSMEVGWTKGLTGVSGYEWDVAVGSVIILGGGLLMFRGFKTGD
jgi:hypothetical protein